MLADKVIPGFYQSGTSLLRPGRAAHQPQKWSIENVAKHFVFGAAPIPPAVLINVKTRT